LSSLGLSALVVIVVVVVVVVDVPLLWHKNSSLYEFARSSLSNVIRKQWDTGRCPEYPKFLSK